MEYPSPAFVGITLFAFIFVSREVLTAPTANFRVIRASAPNAPDKFTVVDTSVRCDNELQKQVWCQGRNADSDRTQGSCSCVCRRNYLTFLPEVQTCVSNMDVYSFLGGCSKRARDQTGFPPLPLISGPNARSFQFGLVPWPSQYVWYSSSEMCTINHRRSSYRIHGKWMPINKGVFSLRRRKQYLSIKTVLQWSDDVPDLYSGRILRLDLVNCSNFWRSDVRHTGGCLLLKVAGNVSAMTSPRTGANSESPAKVDQTPTEASTALVPPICSSNTPVITPLNTKGSGLPSSDAAVSLNAKPDATTEPSSALNFPPPSSRPGGHGREITVDVRFIIMIGGAMVGFLVLVIVVAVLVNRCRTRRRSEDCPIKNATQKDGQDDEASKITSNVANDLQDDRSCSTNVAYQVTDIINGLQSSRPKDGQTKWEEAPPEVDHKHETAERAHMGLPDEEPDYHVLEEDGVSNDVSHNGPMSDEGPADAHLDYDVLERPDSIGSNEDYGTLDRRTCDDYATPHARNGSLTRPSVLSGGQMYASLQQAGGRREYQTMQSRLGH